MERSWKKRLCLPPTNITYEVRGTYANATDDGVKMGRAGTTKLEQFLEFGKFNEELSTPQSQSTKRTNKSADDKLSQSRALATDHRVN